MKKAKKLLALVMTLVMLSGVFTLSMPAKALDLGNLGGIFGGGESNSEPTEKEPPLAYIDEMIQDFLAKIRAIVIPLLEKLLGITIPVKVSSFVARTWPADEQALPASSTLVNEYINAINAAKASTEPLYISRDVSSTFSVACPTGSDEHLQVGNFTCGILFPEYVCTRLDSRKQEFDRSDCIEPVGTQALLDSSKVKSVTRTLNPDLSYTYELVLYSESYTQSPPVHSGVIGNTLSGEDFNLDYSQVVNFAAHLSEVKLTAVVSKDGVLLSQSARIPAYYDVELDYTTKVFSGRSFFTADVITNIRVNLTWK